MLSFFCLSGFVIAEALDVFYRDSVYRFAVNRFLKIFPAFWAVSLLTALVFTLGGAPFPHDGATVFANITLLGSFFRFANNKLLITGGWAVIVELVFYIVFALTWLGVRRLATPGRGLWLTAVLFLVLYWLVSAQGQFTHSYSNLRYAPLFILGASLYWTLSRRSTMAAVLLAVSCVLALHAYWIYTGGTVAGLPSLVLFALSLCVFGLLSVMKAPAPFKRVDRWLGDFTYALYLVNGLIIFAVMLLPLGGVARFMVALFAGVTLSVLIHLAVEKPIIKLRARVRGRMLYGS